MAAARSAWRRASKRLSGSGSSRSRRRNSALRDPGAPVTGTRPESDREPGWVCDFASCAFATGDSTAPPTAAVATASAVSPCRNVPRNAINPNTPVPPLRRPDGECLHSKHQAAKFQRRLQIHHVAKQLLCVMCGSRVRPRRNNSPAAGNISGKAFRFRRLGCVRRPCGRFHFARPTLPPGSSP